MKYIFIGSSCFVYTIKSIVKDLAILRLYKNPDDFSRGIKLKDVEIDGWSTYLSSAI